MDKTQSKRGVVASKAGLGVVRNGLFFLHDTKGIPLGISIMLCRQKGEQPNLAEFFFDSMVAGWNPDNSFSTIEAACRDNDLPYDYDSFKRKLAIIWTEHREWDRCAKAVQ